jgi:hypothetical protein
MIKIRGVLALALSCVIFFGGLTFVTCSHDPVYLDEFDTICFEQKILPLLQTYCGIEDCHDAAAASDGFIAADYASIMKAVTPGDVKGSLLYQVITDFRSDDMMPPDKPLSQDQRTLIHLWIAQGAVNSDCPVSNCDTAGIISFSAKVNPLIQTNCVGCHNAGMSRGGVNLDGYAQVKYYAETTRNGVTLLEGTINGMAGFTSMPPSGSLSGCNIRQIELWIDQGKQNN